mgnify:CR=1 FL=1
MRQKSIEVEGLSHHGRPSRQPAASDRSSSPRASWARIPTPGTMPADPETQAVLCFENLKRVLAAGGMDLGDVVKADRLSRQRSLSHRRQQALA